MKTAEDIIKRILWDSALRVDHVVVGYEDRFVGVIEKKFTAFNWANFDSLSHMETAIPRHRIVYFKYQGHVMWDKTKRIDEVFGSTGGNKLPQFLELHSLSSAVNVGNGVDEATGQVEGDGDFEEEGSQEDGVLLSPYPKYFYLDWEKRQAIFLPECPDDAVFVDGGLPFSLGSTRPASDSQVEVFLCHSIPSNDLEPFDLGEEDFYSNFKLLKSHLQKCTRRSLSEPAQSTLLHLLRMNPDEIMRRLPIIVVEDVHVNIQLPTLVWIMMAVVQGMKLSEPLIDWLVNYVHAIASHPYRESFDKFDSSEFKLNDVTKIRDPLLQSVLYCMQARRVLGGMSGDMLMLTKLCNEYLHRFVDYEKDPEREAWVWDRVHMVGLPRGTQAIHFQDVPFLEIEAFELSAIDFHCCNIALEIGKAFPGIDVDNVRRAMWHCSSRLTDKRDLTDLSLMPSLPATLSRQCPCREEAPLLVLWEKIEPIAVSIAKEILLTRGLHVEQAQPSS